MWSAPKLRSLFSKLAMLMLGFLFLLTNALSAGAITSDDTLRSPYIPTPAIDYNLFADHETGAFVTSYPIEIPPGRNGVQPNLTLLYNNQNTNHAGLFGLGWSLSIPYIQRLNREGSDTLYTSDRFYSTLDGELVKTGATTYRPKAETGAFNQYKFSNNQWTVTDKFGTVHKFGHAAAARQDDPNDSSRIFTWMLEETRDTNDNYVEYIYHKNQGEIYPDSITYTGHGSTDGIFEVSFQREGRPLEKISYAPAFEVKTAQRIKEIQTKVNGTWVRKYELDYSTGNNSNTSLLASITKFGQEGSNVTQLQPEQFTYQNPPTTWTTNVVTHNAPFFSKQTSTGDIEYEGTASCEVNGDGLTDFIQIQGSTNGVYLNDGSNKWPKDTSWSTPDEAAYPYLGFDNGGTICADANGDGFDDIIHAYKHQGQQYKRIWLNNQIDGWDFAGGGTIPDVFSFQTSDGVLHDNSVFPADLNGDQQIDFVVLDGNVAEGYLANSSSTWETSPSFSLTVSNDDPFAPNLGALVLDVNGDGLADILQAYQDCCDTITVVYLSNGKDSWEEQVTGIPFRLARLDSQGNWVPTDTGPMNVNGDNLIDFVDIDDEKVWLNKGNGNFIEDTSASFPSYTWLSFEDGMARALDTDGDGLDEFIVKHDDNGTTRSRIFFNNGDRADRLKEIENSKGGKTQVAYKHTQEYRDSAGDLINPNLPFGIETVSSITTDDDMGNTWTDTYEYGGGEYFYLDRHDKKFAGFATTTVTNAGGETTTTFLYQGNWTNAAFGEQPDHKSKIGLPYREEVRDDQGNLYQVTIHHWTHENVVGDANILVHTLTIEQDYDGDGDHRDTAKQFQYHLSTGNLLKEINWGEVVASDNGTFYDEPGDGATTTYTYTNNTADWIVGLVATETLEDENGNKIRETRNYYDNEAGVGVVSIGNLTKQERWVTGATYVDTQWVYNGLGLPTSETNPRGRTTTTAYDSDNLYPAAVTNALSQATTFDYDLASGQQIYVTDPNGTRQKTTLDGLGRVTKVEGTNQAGNLTTLEDRTYYDSASPWNVKIEKHLSDGVSAKETYEYHDGLDRLIQTRTAMETTGQWAVRTLKYNDKGLIEKEFIPYQSGSSAYFDTTQSDTQANRFTYDALNRVTALTNALGTTATVYDQWTEQITDAEGNEKTLHRDARGRIEQIDKKLGTQTLTSLIEWNFLDKRTKLTDEEGNVANFTYNGLGDQTTAEQIHNPAATAPTHTYYRDANGNVTDHIYPDGTTLAMTYDDLDRVLTEDNPAATGTDLTHTYDTAPNGIGKRASSQSSEFTITYEYDKQGNLDKETRTIEEATTGAGGATFTIYDDSTTWADWSWGSTRDFSHTTTVDEGSNSIEVAYTSAWGGLALHDNTGVDTTSYNDLKFSVHGGSTGGQNLYARLYTPGNHLLGTVNLSTYIGTIAANTWYDVVIPLADLGATATTVGSVNVESATNNTTIYVDHIRFEGSGGSGYSQGTYVTEYAYDDKGALTSIDHPDGTTQTYTYNRLGLMETVIKDTTTLISDIDYGPHDQVTFIDYGNGVDEDRTYDQQKLWRMTNKTVQSGTNDLLDTDYTYDNVNNITGITDTGTELAKTATYSFDDLNRLTSSTIDSNTCNYTYSDAGRMLTHCDHGTYTYGDDRHPHAVTNAGNITYTYDANGNATQKQISGGGGASQTIYDDATSWADWSWGSTRDFSHTTTVDEGSNSIEVQYTSAWGGLALHDNTGIDTTSYNDLKFSVHGGSTGGQNLYARLYTPGNHLLGTVNLSTYIGTIAANTWYDVVIPLADLGATATTVGSVNVESATNNTTIYVDHIRFEGSGGGSSQTYNFTYDYKQRLNTVTNGSDVTTYINGVASDRVQKRLADGSRRSYLGGTAKVDETNNHTNYYFANSNRIGIEDTNGLHYNLTDHLSSASLLLDISGNTAQKLDYHPYGAERINTKTGSFETRHTFTDQEKDSESGLMYYGARYYDAEVGRFLQYDPPLVNGAYSDSYLIQTQPLSGYTYADNNPLVYIDPTGEAARAVNRRVRGTRIGVHSFVEITDNPNINNGERTTLGGYTTGFIFGDLFKGENYHTDYDLTENDYIATHDLQAPVPYSQQGFEELIYESYQNLDTWHGAYSPFGGDLPNGQGNSGNVFTEILTGAGLSLDQVESYGAPGFNYDAGVGREIPVNQKQSLRTTFSNIKDWTQSLIEN